MVSEWEHDAAEAAEAAFWNGGTDPAVVWPAVVRAVVGCMPDRHGSVHASTEDDARSMWQAIDAQRHDGLGAVADILPYPRQVDPLDEFLRATGLGDVP